MASNEQSGLDLAELDTIFGKMFVDPIVVVGLYDHPQVPGWLSSEGVSGSAKSVLLVQGTVPTVRLHLTISAQEAYGILDKAARAIQARGEE